MIIRVNLLDGTAVYLNSQHILRFQLSASRGTAIELSNDTVLHVDQSPETLSIWINGD